MAINDDRVLGVRIPCNIRDMLTEISVLNPDYFFFEILRGARDRVATTPLVTETQIVSRPASLFPQDDHRAFNDITGWSDSYLLFTRLTSLESTVTFL